MVACSSSRAATSCHSRSAITASADGKLVTETLDDTPWPEERKVAAEAAAGTLVIFDGRAPHLSAANRSSKSRHAYTLHVIDQKLPLPDRELAAAQ